MIRLDGSQGEGGGQILRTSLGLSLATGQPFRLEQIRAGRQKPGLMRQHLTAVLAAAEIGAATVEGAALGSTTLTFSPGAVRPGTYRFAVGTAGSAGLVFQAVLPGLLQAREPSELTLEGGTHNPAAPPYEFLERIFLPWVSRLRANVELRFERYGFYPAGGGRFVAKVTPGELRPLQTGPRAETTERKVTAVVAELPRHIAERDVERALRLLGWPAETGEVIETRQSNGPGNVLMIELGSPHGRELVTTFGELGVSAEKVASRAVDEIRVYQKSRAIAGEHLTDQLLVPFALAGGGSFTAAKLNRHARTNMDVIREFLPVRFAETAAEDLTTVEVQPC